MPSERALFMLHGWGMNPHVFDALAAELEAHFKVHALALPGHSALLPAVNTLVSWAAHVAAQLPDDSTVLGWSLGGQIAMRIALDMPHKVGQLILVSTTPRFVRDGDWPAGIAAADLESFGSDLQRDARATVLRFLSLQTRGAAQQKSLLEAVRRSFFSVAPAQPEALAAGLEMLRRADLRREISGLHQRTLVIHGDADKLTPPAAGVWLADALPNAQLMRVAHAAHAPFLSHAPHVAAAIRRWLA